MINCYDRALLLNPLQDFCLDRALDACILHTRLSFPHDIYGIAAWLSKKSQTSLFVLQKRLIRNICNAPYRSHCMLLFHKTNIVTIDDQVILENCKLIYKVVGGLSPTVIASFFKEVGSYATHSTNIAIIKHRLSMVNKSFFWKSVTDWRSLSQFSKRVKQGIVSKY